MTNSKTQPKPQSHQSTRIITKGTCPSISPNSNANLSYDIGYNDDASDDSSGDILFRVTANTGGGYMNTTYWSLKEVLDILASVPDEDHFKSTLFAPIFRGRSANSMGFAVAVMRQEKLLAPVPGKPFSSMKNLSEAAYRKTLQKLIDDPKKSLPDTIAKAEKAKAKKKVVNAKKLSEYHAKKSKASTSQTKAAPTKAAPAKATSAKSAPKKAKAGRKKAAVV
jgi:hypothetical protein